MKKNPKCEFDPVKHAFTIEGRAVPSVTQVIKRVLGQPIMQATDWHMQRGTAVHACAAMVAREIAFEHDPQIAGQVAAIRKFWAEFKPDAKLIEEPVYNLNQQYAGVLDLVAWTQIGLTVIDYKSTVSPIRDAIQIGGYAMCCGDATAGLLVELHEDGCYKAVPIQGASLRTAKRDFQVVRATYGIMQRLNEAEKGGNND